MEIWTTFTPSKVSWELTCAMTKGKSATSAWQKDLTLINKSLSKLRSAGISGIRLVIYPFEITQNGNKFNWESVEKMLMLTTKNKLKCDLCIGPFQYPNYPGIYLPEGLIEYIYDNKNFLDTTQELWNYGMSFIKLQIERFGNDKRVNGFHLANEWPDSQKVFGKESVKKSVSLAFMLSVATFLKDNTLKPICLNTNIDAGDKNKLLRTFKEILNILGKQGRLGFDVYPSQESWKKTTAQKLRRFFWSYNHSFSSIKKCFYNNEIYFSEVEAQPWGGGQSWYQLISEENWQDERILNYHRNSLGKAFNKYIKNSDCNFISLWGSDFWLVASTMGVDWPLNQIKQIFS